MGIWDNIEKWGGDLVSDVDNTFKWSVKQGENVIIHTEDSFSSIISLPLLLISGGIALFLWNSNLGQTQELQKSVGPALLV